MTVWLTGGAPAPVLAAGDAVMRDGAVLITLGGLPQTPEVLLDIAPLPLPPRQGGFWTDPAAIPEWSFSLLGSRDSGLALRCRGPSGAVRHALPGPLEDIAGPLTLIWTWGRIPAHGSGGQWALRLEDAQGKALAQAFGPGAIAIAQGLAQAIARPGPHRQAHPVIGMCAARSGRPRTPAPERLMRGAAIAAHATVATPQGACPVGMLSAGTELLDMNGARVRLAALHLCEVPLGMAFSPRHLRAGRLPMARNLLAGPGLRLLFGGDDIQRILGCPRVLIEAAHLPDPVQRPAALPVATVLMAVPVPERAALLEIGGLTVLCPGPDETVPPGLRCLSRQQAAALLEDLGESRLYAGAA